MNWISASLENLKKKLELNFQDLLYINVNQVHYHIIVCHKKTFWYYNWNCSQFEQNRNFIFLLFCWINIGDILNFKSARLNVKSLPFTKKLFRLKSLQNEFFSVQVRAHINFKFMQCYEVLLPYFKYLKTFETFPK